MEGDLTLVQQSLWNWLLNKKKDEISIKEKIHSLVDGLSLSQQKLELRLDLPSRNKLYVKIAGHMTRVMILVEEKQNRNDSGREKLALCSFEGLLLRRVNGRC